MAITRNVVDNSKFNGGAVLSFELRREDFQMAMQDVYDFFFDVNSHLLAKGLMRLDDTHTAGNHVGRAFRYDHGESGQTFPNSD